MRYILKISLSLLHVIYSMILLMKMANKSFKRFKLHSQRRYSLAGGLDQVDDGFTMQFKTQRN